MQDSMQIGAQRHELTVAKYENGRSPEDGAPDETQVIVVWTDPDGTPITDEARLADLEASRKEG